MILDVQADPQVSKQAHHPGLTFEVTYYTFTCSRSRRLTLFHFEPTMAKYPVVRTLSS